uniref:Uncharacterized protein n=1 Tax=Candidatus Kentrum sp. SD TaxID=2126332 RepID=A0A450Z1E1_9GAMM|nr:MAG: hypothetical protein BECKSD772F_GA0070984_10933 [Candidatus Kentron sp. SD]VFK47559.1 MAG: hypothetical protein BECKSD772E_GA0070983_10983 [Candidatus Kentron sp. SD]VFK80280.1 MAG: hypothetical protein BECKSD772D_GA0070982_10992 [Candidatus Kentron sp. SD]
MANQNNQGSPHAQDARQLPGVRQAPGQKPLLMPMELEGPAAPGVLYISERHVPGINTFGVVDIYQERMSARPQEQDLLPEWAKFARQVVDHLPFETNGGGSAP